MDSVSRALLMVGGASDTNPDAFSFTNVTDANLSTTTTSNTITPTGYDSTSTWSVTNGTASVNGAAYSSSGTISPGQTIALRGVSSSNFSTTTSVVLTIGTTSSTWSITTKAQTEAAYTAQAGTFTFIVPSGVTSISVVCVGGGGGGGTFFNGSGQAGGNLRYVNNITVTPGESLTVVVGAGNSGTIFGSQNTESKLQRLSTNLVNSGYGYTVGELGTGGNGGGSYGGGGAGGYTGNGGSGGGNSGPTGYSGSGGGGGGGGGFYSGGGVIGQNVGENYSSGGGGGGGVGVFGQGASGAGAAGAAQGGGGGSGGNSGGGGSVVQGGSGGLYGGSGASSGYYYQYYLDTYYDVPGTTNTQTPGGPGARGAVRIIWPGTTRQFPSTNTGAI